MVPVNCFISFVQFCFRSLGPFERCDTFFSNFSINAIPFDTRSRCHSCNSSWTQWQLSGFSWMACALVGLDCCLCFVWLWPRDPSQSRSSQCTTEWCLFYPAWRILPQLKCCGNGPKTQSNSSAAKTNNIFEQRFFTKVEIIHGCDCYLFHGATVSAASWGGDVEGVPSKLNVVIGAVSQAPGSWLDRVLVKLKLINEDMEAEKFAGWNLKLHVAVQFTFGQVFLCEAGWYFSCIFHELGNF